MKQNQTNAANVTMNYIGQAIWGDIWETHTGEKLNKCDQCYCGLKWTKADKSGWKWIEMDENGWR